MKLQIKFNNYLEQMGLMLKMLYAWLTECMAVPMEKNTTRYIQFVLL